VLFQQGLIAFDDKRIVSEKWIKSLVLLSISDEIRYVVDQYANMWLQLTVKIKEIEQQMALQAKKDDYLNV